MAALLKDAIKPNLVQTLEGTPAFVHGGPLRTSPTAATASRRRAWPCAWANTPSREAGFGADLGAEKFFDIKCRMSGLRPSAVVVVARSGPQAPRRRGQGRAGQGEPEALERGLPNLLRHVENIKTVYGLPCVVAINRFPADTEAELALVSRRCRELGVNAPVRGLGQRRRGRRRARARGRATLRGSERFPLRLPGRAGHPQQDRGDRQARIPRRRRGLHRPGRKELSQLEALGFGALPVCMAKTQYSFSDDASKLRRA